MSTNANNNVSEKPDSLKATQFGGDHYKSMGIEPVQYIEANGINFTLGSAIKYITRHSVKNGAVDLKKAVHFIAMDLERVYGIKLTFNFSDDVQLPPDKQDNSNELHGPGGEIDLREHGPGVDFAVPVKVKTAEELVKEVYPRAWIVGCRNTYSVDQDHTAGGSKWLSEDLPTVEEAWQAALVRIRKLQLGPYALNASISTPISTPTPLPSNSLQPHVAAHPPTAIRASEPCCGKTNEPRRADL